MVNTIASVSGNEAENAQTLTIVNAGNQSSYGWGDDNQPAFGAGQDIPAGEAGRFDCTMTFTNLADANFPVVLFQEAPEIYDFGAYSLSAVVEDNAGTSTIRIGVDRK